jgi:hypothetical protein
MGAAAILARLGALCAGAGALVFAVLVLYVLAPPAGLERAAARIIAGDRYKAEDIDRLAAAIDPAAPLVRAASLRAAAILALRRAEDAIAEGRRIDIDDSLAALARLAPAALCAAPADAFLWLASFWRHNVAEGFAEASLPRLAMSYATGPNEGWIGVKRSAATLAVWERLPPELRERAVGEFAGLVQSRFREMAEILIGPGWMARDVLLRRLAPITDSIRKAFARALYKFGADVDVPGVDKSRERPWDN